MINSVPQLFLDHKVSENFTFGAHDRGFSGPQTAEQKETRSVSHSQGIVWAGHTEPSTLQGILQDSQCCLQAHCWLKICDIGDKTLSHKTYIQVRKLNY